jgi:hypothetical protein
MTSREPPGLWYVFLQGLTATPALARQLWDVLPDRDAVLWQLQLVEARAQAHRPAAAVARVRRLAQVLTSSMLMEACARLAPETHSERPPDIRQIEEAILQMIDHEGKWKW